MHLRSFGDNIYVLFRREADVSGNEGIIQWLPRSLDNLGHITHTNSMNLDFDFTLSIRLHGPSGDLRMVRTLDHLKPRWDSQTLRFLNKLPISSA